MVVVETVRGVTTRVRFLPLILTSLGSKEWNALLAESLKRCQHYFDALTTNPLLLELKASTSGKDVPTFEGPQHLLRKLVDLRLQPITCTRDHDAQKSSAGQNLGPRQRRGPRPYCWRRPRRWRRSRRGSGAGGWRCRRCRSSSWRWRRCTSSYRSKDVDTTPTVDVVWRARGSALSRIDVDSRVIQRIAARRKLVSQAGNSRP